MAWKVTNCAPTPDVSVSQSFLIFSSRPESNASLKAAQPVSLGVSISFRPVNEFSAKRGWTGGVLFCTGEHVTSCLTADSSCKVRRDRRLRGFHPTSKSFGVLFRCR